MQQKSVGSVYPYSSSGHTFQHSLCETDAVFNGKLLKCRIIHVCAVICLIGDRTDDQEWDSVKSCCLSDCCTFHLNRICAELFYNIVFNSLITDKLISGSNSSLKYLDLRIYLCR